MTVLAVLLTWVALDVAILWALTRWKQDAFEQRERTLLCDNCHHSERAHMDRFDHTPCHVLYCVCTYYVHLYPAAPPALDIAWVTVDPQ